MDEDVETKMKRWINAIAAEEIAGIIPELCDFFESSILEKTANKIYFKLVQYLSHSAYKCDRSKIKLGGELSMMTQLLCNKLTELPNTKKFFSSIYHITSCLLEMKLYNEGMEICDFLTPKYKLFRADETISELQIYEPLSTLWHKISVNLLKTMESCNEKIEELFLRMVKYELYLIKFANDESSTEIVSRILSHSRRIISRNNSNMFHQVYKNSMLDYMKTVDITLKGEKCDNTWQLICELITIFIGKDINSTNVYEIEKNYKSYFDAFRPSIMTNQKYVARFDLWQRLCDTLLKSIDNLTKDCSERIKRWITEFDRIPRAENHKTELVYCHAILQLLTSILNYWEEHVKSKETMEGLTVEMIIGIIKLSTKLAHFFGQLAIDNCHCESTSCNVKTDLSNKVVLEVKCLSLIARRPVTILSEKIRKIGQSVVDSCLRSFKTMKKAGCAKCQLLWIPCGAVIYNIAVATENTFPDESIKFYTDLMKSIVDLEGLRPRKMLWGFEDPLGMILHRLSSVCIKNEKYERAKSFAAMNALLSHDITDSKAYRDWTNVKCKDSNNSNTTILQYLRSNDLEIPRIRIEDYDLVEVCLREIKSLQECHKNFGTPIMAILDEIEGLEFRPLDYAKGVQLLAYDSLNFDEKLPIKKYLWKASLLYERESSPCADFLCAYATIKFAEFVEKTRNLRRKTESEMESALYALTVTEKTSESLGTNGCDVVPAYSAINMSITSELGESLKQALSKWRQFSQTNYEKNNGRWEIRYTIHAIKIAGEYARLYKFDDLENEAWSILYKMANDLTDAPSIIYATSRALACSNFDTDWISQSEKQISMLADSQDRNTADIIVRYRLCLADYYYNTDQTDKAEEMYRRVSTQPGLKFMQDFSNFPILKDLQLRHHLKNDETYDQSTYSNIIIQSLYTLLSMDDVADTTIYGEKEKQLYDYQTILDCTNNLALRMNSLLSFREISAHLSKRLSLAQKLVCSIRVAECLKFLCYIDLSRSKTDDCEVKLQGLEHILEIEAFDKTMKSKLSPCRDEIFFFDNPNSNNRYTDTVRDIGQSGASPVLRKKVFAKPDFMLHGDRCSCFKCTNEHYQYLIFACTHIRAQLFALHKNVNAAFQHFHGAMRIRKTINEKKYKTGGASIKDKVSSFSPMRQDRIVEYVLFHLDYCRFLDWSMPDTADKENGAEKIALDALEMCEKYNLRNHPVHMAVNEFILQRRFRKLFAKHDFSKFMVPDMSEVDIKNTDNVDDPGICVTPIRDIIEKRPISVRRRKTPPFLKLDRVPIDLVDDGNKDDETTKLPNFSTTKTRRLRRKICEDEDYCEQDKPDKPIVPQIKISSAETKKTLMNPSSSIPEVVKKIEDLQLQSRIRSRMKKSDDEATNRDLKKPKKKIDEVTELLNVMSVSKDENTPNKIDLCSKIVIPEVVVNCDTDRLSDCRRVSSRLQNKTSRDSEPKNSEDFKIAESKSDDEPVTSGSRSSRRLYSSKEENVTSTDRTATKNRSRTSKTKNG